MKKAGKIIAAALVLSMLAGCSSETNESSEQSTSEEIQELREELDDDELKEIQDAFKDGEEEEETSDENENKDGIYDVSYAEYAIHTAFLTAIIDPRLPEQANYEKDLEMLKEGVDISEFKGPYDFNENPIFQQAAEMLNVDNFDDFKSLIKKQTGSITITYKSDDIIVNIEDASEPKVVEYEHFDPVPEWGEYKPGEGVYQVDDVLYVPGISAESLFNLIDSSSIDYSYDYSPNKLVVSGGREDIEIFRDDVVWFKVTLTNFSKETVSLSQCMFTDISGTAESYKYSYIMDGRSFDSFYSMTYDEVKALQNDVLINYQCSEHDENGKIRINYIWPLSDRDFYPVERTEWSGYRYGNADTYSFWIDPDTGMVDRFGRNSEILGRYGNGGVYKEIK